RRVATGRDEQRLDEVRDRRIRRRQQARQDVVEGLAHRAIRRVLQRDTTRRARGRNVVATTRRVVHASDRRGDVASSVDARAARAARRQRVGDADREGNRRVTGDRARHVDVLNDRSLAVDVDRGAEDRAHVARLVGRGDDGADQADRVTRRNLDAGWRRKRREGNRGASTNLRAVRGEYRDVELAERRRASATGVEAADQARRAVRGDITQNQRFTRASRVRVVRVHLVLEVRERGGRRARARLTALRDQDAVAAGKRAEARTSVRDREEEATGGGRRLERRRISRTRREHAARDRRIDAERRGGRRIGVAEHV